MLTKADFQFCGDILAKAIVFSSSSTILMSIPTEMVQRLSSTLSLPVMMVVKRQWKEGKAKKLELNEMEIETMRLFEAESMFCSKYLIKEELSELRRILAKHCSEEIVNAAMKSFEKRNV